ncbi:MAG TPA: hypothetical protein VL134_08635, partial [Leptolyngbya sp.]|nr:hypothetical protein [Leptolyngbya sp.]
MNKHLPLSLVAGLVAGSTIAAFQPSANAASFTAQDAVNAGCVGLTSCTVNGFYLKATDNSTPAQDRTITQKTIDGVVGLGVRNGMNSDPSSGEIDFNEILSVGFGQPNQQKALTLKSIDLSFLYQPGVYSDKVYEVALVSATGGSQVGKLRVTGDTSAVWSLGGTVTNLAASIVGSGGSYRITNPFGDDKITGVKL